MYYGSIISLLDISVKTLRKSCIYSFLGANLFTCHSRFRQDSSRAETGERKSHLHFNHTIILSTYHVQITSHVQNCIPFALDIAYRLFYWIPWGWNWLKNKDATRTISSLWQCQKNRLVLILNWAHFKWICFSKEQQKKLWFNRQDYFLFRQSGITLAWFTPRPILLLLFCLQLTAHLEDILSTWIAK